MMGFWKRAAVSVVILGIGGAAVAQDELSIGDPAPALDVLEWVKGDAVDLAALKGKNVVLLDLFSVNDRRVPEQTKHLNTLQEKYAAAGLKVVGLAIENVDEVKRFVGEHEFKYVVGVDNVRNTCGAYGRPQGTLTAIVDKEGRLAWRGYVGTVDLTLEKIMAGKYDVEGAKKTLELEREMVRQINTQDPDKIEPAADAVLAQDPSHMGAVNVRKQCFVKRDDPKAFREWIAKHVPKVTEAESLNAVAWDLVTTDALPWRESGAALAAATKAVELTQGKNGAMIDTLARVYYEIGLVDRAIETQNKAIAALAADASDDEKKQYQDTLAYYQACAALAKTLKPEPPKKPDPKKPDPKKK